MAGKYRTIELKLVRDLVYIAQVPAVLAVHRKRVLEPTRMDFLVIFVQS